MIINNYRYIYIYIFLSIGTFENRQNIKSFFILFWNQRALLVLISVPIMIKRIHKCNRYTCNHLYFSIIIFAKHNMLESALWKLDYTYWKIKLNHRKNLCRLDSTIGCIIERGTIAPYGIHIILDIWRLLLNDNNNLRLFYSRNMISVYRQKFWLWPMIAC